MTSVSGIYVIRNKKNNKVYIGSSFDIRKRTNAHKNDLRKGKHHNKYLQNSWNKYGERSFEFKILERCEIDMLLEREQFWINSIGNELTYNIAQNTSAPMLGLKHTAETLARMAKSQTGRKHSLETLAKMSIAQKNRVFKPHEIERMRTISIGRKATPETRAKLSAMRQNPSAELRYKFGNATRGKKRKPESVRKSTEAKYGTFIVTNPLGEEFTVIGLAPFCREHGLDQGTMSRVALGKSKSHKGWKCRKVV